VYLLFDVVHTLLADADRSRFKETSMQLRRREFGLLAAGALAAPYVVRAQPINLATLHEAARKEGELTWYTVPQTSEVAEKMGRTFSTRYPGVKVNVVRTTAQVAFQRLNQDLKAGTPNCDVFTSTDLAHYVDLKGRNLLLKYLPAAVARQDKRVQNMDPDAYFHASSCFMMGLIYNTQKVQAAAAPKSWNDLLDAKWSGAALVAHPAYSGAAGAWCIEMRKLFGEGWFAKLAAAKAHVSRSTIDAVTTVISGRPDEPGRALGLARQPRGHAGAERGPGADPFAVGDHGQHPAAERLAAVHGMAARQRGHGAHLGRGIQRAAARQCQACARRARPE
jgi:iron(III) transport system substrate-binding protein